MNLNDLSSDKARVKFACAKQAIGHVLKALALFKQEIRTKKAIVEFIQRQTQNSRPAVRKKAEALLKIL